MWMNYSMMNVEDKGDKLRLYFNYEEEQAKARRSYPNLEEHPNKEKYFDFDYTASKYDLPHISVIPEISPITFSRQMDKGIDFLWCIKNGAMLLGDVAVFKTIERTTDGYESVVVRLCVGPMSCWFKQEDWEGQQLQYI